MSNAWFSGLLFGVGRTYLHQTFTECVSIQYTHFRHARCYCRLAKALWFYYVFWVFSYIIDKNSCLMYFISTKLSQIMCLINLNTLICQHIKCDCRLWKVIRLNCVFWEFSYITTCLKRYYFIKLLQIVYYVRSVEIRSKPMYSFMTTSL